MRCPRGDLHDTLVLASGSRLRNEVSEIGFSLPKDFAGPFYSAHKGDYIENENGA